MAHTPTPWHVFKNRHIGLDGNNQGQITPKLHPAMGAPERMPGIGLHWSGIQGAANAAFIVRAVNNHEALVSALEALTEYVEDDNPGAVKADAWVAHLIEDARAALKAVKS